MPYVLGVDIGRTRGAAAVCRHDGPPDVVDSDFPPLLAVADGAMVVGALARALPVASVAADLLEHIGDDVPLLLDGVAYTAHDLLAALVASVADRVADAEGAPPDRVAVTHPPEWGTYRRGLLRDALAAAGYPGALLLPTVVAAAEAEHFRAPLRPGESLGVALLGGRRVEFAVLHRGPTAFDMVGHTALPDAPAGADLTGAEDIDRPVLAAALDAFRSYLAADAPARAVVAGGAARAPLVPALAAALPATVADDPATIPARGAALAARPRLGLPAPRAGGCAPGLRPVATDGSDPAVRPAAVGGSDPGLRPVRSDRSGQGSRPAGSDPGFRPIRPDGSDPEFRPGGPGAQPSSDGRLRPVGDSGRGLAAVAGTGSPPSAGGAVDTIDTVVSHPGFPPVRLPVDAEPPPRPPVEITPLAPPRRRFGRRGGTR